MILAALLGLLVQQSPAGQRVEITIPADYQLIEGVASDGETIWVSSILGRAIIEHRGGGFRAFPMPDGAGAPFAIAYDKGRDWLWIAAHCSSALKIAGCRGAWLAAMDREGAIKARLRPAGDAPFTPGDVSVWADQVFVSDSANGAVYRCAGDCDRLTALIEPRQKGSAQGTAAYDEGRKLLVADYGLGLISVDLASGVKTPVLLEDGKPLRGIDGLVADGQGFVAIRNPSVPGRAWRFRISPDNRIVDVELAAEGGGIVDPTQIAHAGDRLLIVGDAQWSAHLPDAQGRVSGIQKPTPIVAIPARR